MKNSIYNKREVPSVHLGCSMAETGVYDDFDNPLKALNIIPENKENTVLVRTVEKFISDGEYHEEVRCELSSEIENPSHVMDERFTIMVVVPSGVHPFTYLKEIGVDMTKDWVFLHEDVVDVLRKLPCMYHQETVAYGEFFRFEDFDEVSLQKVKYFADWKVILEGKINEEEFYRPERLESVIEVVMGK